MSCNIKITKAFGSGDPLNKITVIGTVEDCPDGIDGSNLEIELSCRSLNDSQAKKRVSDIDAVGNWKATFLGPFPICACSGDVFIKARCLSVEGCEAAPFAGKILCEDCPSFSFEENDDVSVTNVSVECDLDGSILVKTSFHFFNDTASIIQARVNCGPGGTLVSNDFAFVTPGSSVAVNAICRYDPAFTPIPAPFVEFMKHDGFQILDCPPIPIPMPPIPECEEAVCPLTAVLEVKDSNGDVVLVDGPNAVLCLLPGQYTVEVVSPLPQPAVEYFWSKDSALIQPLETGQSISIDIAEGETCTLSVAIVVEGCPPLTASATLEACVLDCKVDLSFILRDDQNNAITIDQGCIPPGNYTLVAEGPVEPPWDFQWKKNGVISTIITSSEFPFSIQAEESISIEVIASAPACEDKSEIANFQGCEEKNDGDDDKPGCAALLFTAIGMLIAGAILLIIGFCLGEPVTTTIGGITVAIGLILLGIWLFFCLKTTSCEAMQKARCMLFYAGAIFLVVSLFLSWFNGISCGITGILSGIGWFGLSSLITDAMIAKGCEVKSCTF